MVNYKVDDIVKGKVTGMEDYGIFLSLEDNVTGLIHISEISSSFVRNVADYVKLGEEIHAKVIGIDEDGKKLRLSIKDFDYRGDNKHKVGIIETKSGFTNLQKALDKWVPEKVKEIDKNQKKA